MCVCAHLCVCVCAHLCVGICVCGHLCVCVCVCLSPVCALLCISLRKIVVRAQGFFLLPIFSIKQLNKRNPQNRQKHLSTETLMSIAFLLSYQGMSTQTQSSQPVENFIQPGNVYKQNVLLLVASL